MIQCRIAQAEVGSGEQDSGIAAAAGLPPPRSAHRHPRAEQSGGAVRNAVIRQHKHPWQPGGIQTGVRRPHQPLARWQCHCRGEGPWPAALRVSSHQYIPRIPNLSKHGGGQLKCVGST